MALGQTIFRDSRRRRVLQDEARRAGNVAPSPVTEGARYTNAANVENHPQVTQLIPRRYRSYALGLTLAAGGIAAIELAHIGSHGLASAIASGPVVAFDLTAGGGLAAWFSSLVLATLAVVACVVYSLRRHRVDDYRARYRLWLWVAGAAVLASADSVAQLHQVWSSLWVSQTGWAAWGGAEWWLAPAGVFGGWLALRLLLETAECRGACSLVFLSASAYVAALLASVGVLPRVSGTAELIIVSSAVLVGHVFALAAVTLYARYVVLDVQGLILRKAAKSRTQSRQGAEARPAAASNSASAGNGPAFPATIPLGGPAAEHQRKESRKARHRGKNRGPWMDGSEPDEDDFEHNADAPKGKLSKAERKRLRKQRRQCA